MWYNIYDPKKNHWEVSCMATSTNPTSIKSISTAGNNNNGIRNFSDVIREAGFSQENFPFASRLFVTVFDEKGEKLNRPLYGHLKYAYELFLENQTSKAQFGELLRELDSLTKCHGLKVTITQFFVRVQWDGCGRVRSFSRMPPPNLSSIFD